MFNVVRTRIKQGHRTIGYPKQWPVLPDRYLGLPRIDQSKCRSGCADCVEVCPQQAIAKSTAGVLIDLGRCIFCGDCRVSCQAGAIGFTGDFRMASASREGLLLRDGGIQPVQPLDKERLSLFGRSFRLRQVSAGGCNACESDINVLGTVVFDMARFGIDMVASPRHADGILVTGPVTQNMKYALTETYKAVPAPSVVIASGSCAITGGPFRDCAAVNNGVDGSLPVDLYIPGCPPHPLTILDGLLRILGRKSWDGQAGRL